VPHFWGRSYIITLKKSNGYRLHIGKQLAWMNEWNTFIFL
jgi:hypothetical protein